ncbi:Putrescine transporter PotE [Mycolicibacterium aubagnense]
MTQETSDGVDQLKRSIDWKQGLAIALGVPLLILPSLGYLPTYVAAAAILVWGLSILQTFFQNTAYAELATTFPEASGLPGFVQHVFRTKNYKGRYDKGKLLGGFSAWSYWFAWNPVLSIFAILVGNYLHGLFPALAAHFTQYELGLLSGLVIFTGLSVVNWFGLKDGAILGYILAAVSLVPLAVLTIAPFATGHIDLANITGNWAPADWAWDAHHILIIFGIFSIALWSTGGWETAAIYAPEYKKPGRDVPKALYTCGVICFFSFVLVEAAVIGVLGVDGVLAEPISPLIPVAHAIFGQAGTTATIVMLIAAMILIIQTAYLGSAHAMHSMAEEGNFPKVFGRTNRQGTPFVAMFVTAAFNMALIFIGFHPGHPGGRSHRLHLRQRHQPVRLCQEQNESGLRQSGTTIQGTQGLEVRCPGLWPVQCAAVPDRRGLPEQPGNRLDFDLPGLRGTGGVHPDLAVHATSVEVRQRQIGRDVPRAHTRH